MSLSAATFAASATKSGSALAPSVEAAGLDRKPRKPLRSGLLRGVQKGPRAEQKARGTGADERGDDEQPQLTDSP
jgi:hypothetical protein